MLPLSDKAFYATAFVWFALLTTTPRGAILVLSLGQSRISDTGVKALRWLGGFFALVALGHLAWIFIR
jgi:hypothetical protein